MSTNRPTPGLVLAICGAVLQTGATVILLSVTRGLLGAFSTLGVSGLGDPAGLAGAAGEVLASLAVGFVLSLPGLVLLCVALVGFRYRAHWLFCFLLVDGIFLIAAFPVGTAFGTFFFIYIRAHRQEFGEAALSSHTA